MGARGVGFGLVRVSEGRPSDGCSKEMGQGLGLWATGEARILQVGFMG